MISQYGKISSFFYKLNKNKNEDKNIPRNWTNHFVRKKITFADTQGLYIYDTHTH